MNIISWLFACIFIGISLVVYQWQHNYTKWQKTEIKKKIINWYGCNVIGIIYNNNYDIYIFDVIYNNLLKLDSWNLYIINLDNNFDQLKQLTFNNSGIYIVKTKFMINDIYKHIQSLNISIKNPFIILNTNDEEVIIHKFFFNKSTKENDYIKVPLINLNYIKNQSIKEYIKNKYSNDIEFYVIYGNDGFKTKENINKYFNELNTED